MGVKLDMFNTQSDGFALGPGEVIFKEGDPGRDMYVILDGEVEIVYQRPTGGEIFLDCGHPGETFGEAALIRAAPRNATVRAGQAPVRLLPISAEMFDRLVNESPHFRKEMEQFAAQRSQHLSKGGAS